MEEHFRKKLKNHKVDWDKEELLISMEQELSKHKSKFDWRFLLLLPLLFIATCWGINKSEFVAGQHADLTYAKSTSNSNLEKKKTDTDVAIATPISNNPTKKISNNNKPKSESPINTQSQKNDSNFNLIKNDPTVFSIEKNIIPKNSKLQNSRLTTENIKLTNHSSPSILNSKTHSTNGVDHEGIKLTELLPNLEITKITFDREVQLELPPQKMDPLESILVKEDTKFKNSFFVSSSVEVGGIIQQKTNFATNDLEFLELLINNEKTETSRVMLSSNLSVGYQHQSGWSLESGLEYNEILGFFKYRHLVTDTVPAYNESAFYFLNLNADTLFFGDTTSVVRTEERIIRHWNKRPYFSVPLAVRYRHAVGNTNIFGTVGISFAFAHKFKGRMSQLEEDGTMEIIDNPNFTLKNRIGYQLGLGTEIPLFQRTHLSMKVAYRRSPKLAGESKEQFYQSCNFGVGIKVLLGQNDKINN